MLRLPFDNSLILGYRFIPTILLRETVRWQVIRLKMKKKSNILRMMQLNTLLIVRKDSHFPQICFITERNCSLHNSHCQVRNI